MPPAGKRTRAEAVAVPKRDQIIFSAWLRGVLEPRTDLAAAQRMVYPTETVFTAPYVTHIISIRKEKASAFFNLEHHRTTDAHTSRVLGKADTGADKHLYVH